MAFAFLSLQKKGPGTEQPQKQGCAGEIGKGGTGGDMKDLCKIKGTTKY